MTDLVERIQKLVLTTAEEDAAAAEITRQQAVIAELLTALRYYTDAVYCNEDDGSTARVAIAKHEVKPDA